MDDLDLEEERIPEPSSELEEMGITPEQMKEVLSTLPPDASLRDVLNALAKEDPLVWAMMNRRIKGQIFVLDNSRYVSDDAKRKLANVVRAKAKFDFEWKTRLQKHRPFLIQPLRDQHKHKVYMKGRQVGVSELELTEAVWFAATHPNTKTIITFPRETNLETFVSSRVNPALEETAAMKRLVGTPNQQAMKRIADSFLVFRSSWDSALGEGVDADVLVLDEKDRMNPGVEHAFKDSLSASRYGWVREISTPSLPGQGIHFQFAASDQQTWLVRCQKCNLEQEIDWQENIVQVMDVAPGSREIPDGAYEFQCRLLKCRGPLDRLRGRWVAKRPNIKEIRGYHMPQMIFALISASELMRKKVNGRSLQAWLNYEIGVPSSSDAMLLTEQDYDFAVSDPPYKLLSARTADWTWVSVGIDWGHWNWVTVLGLNANGHAYVIGLHVVEDDANDPFHTINSIDNFLTPFDPDIVLGDHGYGQDRNPHLKKRWEGRFYSCRYATDIRSRKALESGRQAAKARQAPRWSTVEVAEVVVDKVTEMFKTCHMIKQRGLGVPSYDEPSMKEWKAHFKNVVPMVVEDPDTEEMLQIVTSKGDDHLANATNYGRIGMVRLAETSNFGFFGL